MFAARPTSYHQHFLLFGLNRKTNPADGDEVVPEGLGVRAPEGRELAHQRPARGSANENWSESAGVDGGSVPRC